jgi:DNA-binding transcriptional LysR family regulator
VTLLERTTREVRLTPAGAALLETAPGVLRAADAAFARAQEVGRGLSGTVRVGVSPAVGPSEREEVVRALREEAPELSVSLREVRPGQVPAALRSGEVAVVVARTAPAGSGIEGTALRPTAAELRVPAGHRLAGRRSLALRELDGERLLVWSPAGTAYTDVLVATLAAAGARVTPVESRVTGTPSLGGLRESGAVALMPLGWPDTGGTVGVPLPRRSTCLWSRSGRRGRRRRRRGGSSSPCAPPERRRAVSRAAAPGASRPRPGRRPRTPAWRSARPARCRCRARRSPRWWGSSAARPPARPSEAPRAGTRGR